MRLETKTDPRRLEENRPAVSPKASCFKCHKPGHIAPHCPLLREEKHRPEDEHRVDACVVEASTGRLSQRGESFPFYFDSGSECSLIKESAASKFSGKRTTHVVVLRGIGNTCIKSMSQILSTVCINGFTFEITFHVLADSNLKYDIMIGREILSQGFDVNITRNSVDICNSKVVNVCNKVAEVAVDINEVDTDVIDNDKDRLISVLENFKESFITGFPRTRVSTGQ